ncbi:hypothetical protein LTR66_007090 [Elasticomyces elasticus]|nr:hypothetical protein LTR66_007090 [Elasticomyces elasticus]
MSDPLNTYFLPGYRLSRYVLQEQICYYCGPRAFARPYTHQGRDGFLISTPGPQLTEAQIVDLREASERYEQEQAALRHPNAEPTGSVNQMLPVGQRFR